MEDLFEVKYTVPKAVRYNPEIYYKPSWSTDFNDFIDPGVPALSVPIG